ncbi:YwhD family protein [Salsuginibacillus kocurii]|uniref:YwhD family protein n=1 Tax=Salsuginibacillus kocurii TaxID=427078 RepID=UPI000376FC86|nr:YwhD family protein [Salsuginibacillus kocurii]
MDRNEKNKQIKNSFNILSGDSTDGHGGYGAGVMSLDNMTPVIVDPAEDRVFIDMGALHARSEIEKRIKLLKDREEVPNAKTFWIVWVTTDYRDGESYYSGVGACEFLADYEIRRGYKSMPEHVNNMDKALKGKIVIEHMDDHSKQLLGSFLQDFDEGMWSRSDESLRDALLQK